MGARKGSKGRKRAGAARKVKAAQDKLASVRAWVERTRIAQGLPAGLTDPEGIRVVLSLLLAGGPRTATQAGRARA